MTENKTLTLTLSIPASLAVHLCNSAAPSFVSEQPDRFWTYDAPGLPDPHLPVFRYGTLMWTPTMSDALILRACEEQSGHIATVLFDEEDLPGGAVILSSRPYSSLAMGTGR
ncbi:hypothetical protein [Nocardioides currus]|nr:hypothetical protein [Nocardioides currus]